MESALLAFVTSLLAVVVVLALARVVAHQKALLALVRRIQLALQPLLTFDSRSQLPAASFHGLAGCLTEAAQVVGRVFWDDSFTYSLAAAYIPALVDEDAVQKELIRIVHGVFKHCGPAAIGASPLQAAVLVNESFSFRSFSCRRPWPNLKYSVGKTQFSITP